MATAENVKSRALAIAQALPVYIKLSLYNQERYESTETCMT
jgi:hypothetical protein